MSILFEPLLATWLIGLLAAIAAGLSAFALYRRQRGATIRAIALALLIGGGLLAFAWRRQQRDSMIL